MIIPKSRSKYTSQNQKLILGSGIIRGEGLGDIFNMLKGVVGPTLNATGRFIKDNKDLLAKPILGAVGSLAATGISKGIPKAIEYLINRKRLKEEVPTPALDKKSEQILETILKSEEKILQRDRNPEPGTNIIGNGLKRGGGLKNF